jgi:hypothetical protein
MFVIGQLSTIAEDVASLCHVHLHFPISVPFLLLLLLLSDNLLRQVRTGTHACYRLCPQLVETGDELQNWC